MAAIELGLCVTSQTSLVAMEIKSLDQYSTARWQHVFGYNTVWASDITL